MKQYDTEASLARLMGKIPPPSEPLETSGSVSAIQFADGRQVVFPPDYLRLTMTYGSGEFSSDEKYGEGLIGNLVHLMNPYAPQYPARLGQFMKILQEYKDDEGDEVVPYAVFPQTPGVLHWGWAEGRISYFWLTEGKPEEWPVLVMYDMEVWTRFDMPMTVFLEQLFFGEIDCSFIGWIDEVSRRDPSKITFCPRIPPGR